MAVQYREVSQRPSRRFHIAWSELTALVGLGEGEVVEVNAGNSGLWFTVLEADGDDEEEGGDGAV